ncbi:MULTISPECIES: LysR family transcriptional regulator [unclassified Symbiopectobacterium]|uniref:LysR family transcriptional regulator n=1 Tax=unclassified Symbiopectobacterium TaxID=2794573 RepID=UPI002227575E|nr:MULTISPECIES: LysR family transcriptional regulator [unclassified Symbiopectobacterium]MCW2475717.1 LysR family transcriptional regulator [Candidatus Symbiopectobacterium sp. NZEC151]MCW2486100.1 LysR family transcriptional regulator [Candidatus Symbiopectobacterium sp. NZEC127]
MSDGIVSNIDRIELMQTLTRIIESGSLSAAAQQMGTTQATISRRLQALEQLLNTKLLLRTTHAMKLTDDGERCYQHARSLIAAWEALEDDLKGADAEPTGVLRVRAPHAFGQEQLIAPLTQFLNQYGQLSVEWMLNDKSPDFIADNIDCAIHVGPATDPATVATRLAEVPRIIVASPTLLAQAKNAIEDIDALAALPWIAIRQFYHYDVTLSHSETGQSEHFSIVPRLTSDSLYAVRQAALSSIGAVIISAWLVEDDIRSGRLIHVLPQWQASPLPVFLLYPYANYYPARLRKFLALMRDAMPGLVGMRKPEFR